MQAAIVRTTIDRKGRQLSEEIIGFEEIDEDTFYRPLVEILGNRILAESSHKKSDDDLHIIDQESDNLQKKTGS